jgi:hypothetical protein
MGSRAGPGHGGEEKNSQPPPGIESSKPDRPGRDIIYRKVWLLRVFQTSIRPYFYSLKRGCTSISVTPGTGPLLVHGPLFKILMPVPQSYLMCRRK